MINHHAVSFSPGLGAGFVAFLGATLTRGVDIVLDAVKFREIVHDADLVITGEGRLDGQSINDKTPSGVAGAAKETGVPVIALCGMVADGYKGIHHKGIDAVLAIANGPITLDESMANASALLTHAAEEVVRLYVTGRKFR